MSESEFLAGVKVEGDDPFAELDKQETDTPAESPAETKPETDKPTEGDAVKEPAANTQEEDEPFHKRWKVREEKLKAELEQDFLAKLEAQKQEFEHKFAHKSDTPAIPEWFSELYGENEVAWQKYQQHSQAEREQIKREIIEEQRQEYVRQQEEIQKWDKWVDNEVVTLEEKIGTKLSKSDRNELIKTILDFKPTDANNHYDFDAGYRIMQLNRLQTQAAQDDKKQARKELADTTIKGNSSEPRKKDYLTPADLRGKSWNSL